MLRALLGFEGQASARPRCECHQSAKYMFEKSLDIDRMMPLHRGSMHTSCGLQLGEERQPAVKSTVQKLNRELNDSIANFVKVYSLVPAASRLFDKLV